jgi:hypothetical protein
MSFCPPALSTATNSSELYWHIFELGGHSGVGDTPASSVTPSEVKAAAIALAAAGLELRFVANWIGHAAPGIRTDADSNTPGTGLPFARKKGQN